MSDMACDVLVIGAGLSGLVAARELAATGSSVVLVDKGRSVGGRLATRRIGGARLDHGAQFFTVRGDDFRSVVDDAIEAGVVHEWCKGFNDPPDGYPRYTGSTGMNALAKWLADGLDIHTGVQITSVSAADGRVTTTADGWSCSASACLITAPVPQTMALLDAGGVSLAPDLDATLRDIRYFATLGLLATVDGETAIDEPGGIQLPETERFTFIADNRRKGISDEAAVTFHANHDHSLARYEDDEAEVLAELLEWARPWLGEATVLEAQLKKWRYAGPIAPVPERVLTADIDGATLAFAGDAFGGPKVEGAFNSGLAAGRRLADVVA